MPFVRIEMLSGRSTEQKTRLAVAITKAMVDRQCQSGRHQHRLRRRCTRRLAVAGKLIVDG